MDIAHLCRMANQIGEFYESQPDLAEASMSTATHLRRFWEPRMRRRLLDHLDAGGGSELRPFVRQAIESNRAMLEPPPAS